MEKKLEYYIWGLGMSGVGGVDKGMEEGKSENV